MAAIRRPKRGHPFLDTLVSDLFTPDVPVSWKGSFPQNSIISDLDLCTLFSSLLKNAYAAAHASDEPFVKVEIKCAGSEHDITITNSVPETVNLKAGAPKRSGGYGIGNIEKIVKSITATSNTKI